MSALSKTWKSALACCLMGAGLGCITNGLASAATAVDCVPGAWIEPADCMAAHAEPAPEGRTGEGCAFENGNCTTQGTGCSSTPTFNGAAKGKCDPYIGGSVIYKCSDDFFKSAITLTRVIGACTSVIGDCSCKYSAAMPLETTVVEVCNCKQEKV